MHSKYFGKSAVSSNSMLGNRPELDSKVFESDNVLLYQDRNMMTNEAIRHNTCNMVLINT